VKQPILFKPVVVLPFEDLPPAAAHAIVHFLHSRFDRHAAAFERCLFQHHV
jgi:hypothetical protein